ncbi:MAG: hypothetical protein QM741_08420 [Rudaea sp.]|uniref:hypothetical protein n=1 Tax=Rudaea sp. TaxID=2136325 RepID=UPI0039E46F05
MRVSTRLPGLLTSSFGDQSFSSAAMSCALMALPTAAPAMANFFFASASSSWACALPRQASANVTASNDDFIFSMAFLR